MQNDDGQISRHLIDPIGVLLGCTNERVSLIRNELAMQRQDVHNESDGIIVIEQGGPGHSAHVGPTVVKAGLNVLSAFVSAPAPARPSIVPVPAQVCTRFRICISQFRFELSKYNIEKYF